MSKNTNVVTYSAPNSFETLSLCDKHDADGRTRYTANGQPFANVSHGRHWGVCDECEADVQNDDRACGDDGGDDRLECGDHEKLGMHQPCPGCGGCWVSNTVFSPTGRGPTIQGGVP